MQDQLEDAALWGFLISAATLLGRWFLATLVKQLAIKVSGKIWFIKAGHFLSLGPLRHKRLNGRWQVSWEVASTNFVPKSPHSSTLYKFFNTILIEGTGIRQDGSKLPYAFIGELSDGRDIITGTWFDLDDRTGGYSGSFQLKLSRSQHLATGLWIGFSENEGIKCGPLVWERLTPPG